MADDALAHAHAVGREAWPDLPVGDAAFAAFVRARVAAEELTVDALGKLALADLYLACACEERVAGAVAAFEAMCMPSIEAALARMGPDAKAIADEVRQIVMDQLFVGARGAGALHSYSGRGNLRGWVRIIAVREAARLLRAAQKRVPIGDEGLFDALAPDEREDPALEYLKAHYRVQFKRAFLHAVSQLPRRERTALRMNVLDGCSIDEIGAAFRVNRSSAHRWLASARELLITGTKAALIAELAISPTEVDSVIRLVRSSLDVTLETALKSRA